MKKSKAKIATNFRLPQMMVDFLKSKPDKTRYLETLIKRDMYREKSIYILNLGGLTESAKQDVLRNLMAEGVPVTEVVNQVGEGYIL